jgi:hypothetical protein
MRIGADRCGFSEVLLRLQSRFADVIAHMRSDAIKSGALLVR